jgi:hypothetical protein
MKQFGEGGGGGGRVGVLGVPVVVHCWGKSGVDPLVFFALLFPSLTLHAVDSECFFVLRSHSISWLK